MLRVLGSPKRLCNGLTRRDLLHAGGLSLLGLSLADYFRLSAVQAGPTKTSSSFGKAKACILLYLYGSPSQLETFDMKPDAPVGIRGELKPIPSTIPGLPVCELLPNLSRQMHLTTVLRSLTHPYPIHGVAYATTGVPAIDVPMELNPRDSRHWPFIGCVVDYLTRRNSGGRKDIPTNMALPFPMSTRRTGEVARAGPYAAFLGSAYNPVWTEFRGEATRHIVKTLADKKLDVAEPYVGISPKARFELAAGTDLPVGLSADRLNRRKSLLHQLDDSRRELDQSDATQAYDRYQRMAYDLVGSEKVRTALDVEREPRKSANHTA